MSCPVGLLEVSSGVSRLKSSPWVSNQMWIVAAAKWGLQWFSSYLAVHWPVYRPPTIPGSAIERLLPLPCLENGEEELAFAPPLRLAGRKKTGRGLTEDLCENGHIPWGALPVSDVLSPKEAAGRPMESRSGSGRVHVEKRGCRLRFF